MKRIVLAAAILLAPLPLAGCIWDQQAPPPNLSLPKAPDYYRLCFAKLTNIPKGTALTRDMIVALVAELRRSEKRLSQCGKDLLKLYDMVVAGAAPLPPRGGLFGLKK